MTEKNEIVLMNFTGVYKEQESLYEPALAEKSTHAISPACI